MQWKSIPSFPGYEASDEGLIRSKNKILSLVENKKGYYSVKISYNKKQVHRLIAEAFLGPSMLSVNHKDGNKKNNFLSNLEYATRAQNMKHASENGLCAVGFRNASCKLSDKNLKEIYSNKTATAKDLSQLFCVTADTIRAIKKRRC